MNYAFWADVVVGFHVAYVGYVVVGQLIILLGLAMRWGWVRNPWFRLTHLAAIAYVAYEDLRGIACPLTIWEARLREWAGQDVQEGSFMGRLFHNILFYDDADQSLFPKLHVGFAVLVVLTFLLAPPRFRKKTATAAASASPALPAPPTSTTAPLPR